mmetsp:Transcript_46625/g.117440  ORF Transcript_46625/g.117440 Transcript_46625/m.117440 type:complete len:245 (-) Transcript_46625:54-788(-)|eukprot:CAMPEP_0174235094 /NCGR_PEP_ID=MMETSP0417-20130205/4639_1 /TAXON_ID=242541 /ORGANISM="Mayorella sp, Strain BSH-02190019" /LENGTH=244 /DNA_ID=CAMNT_0015313549 /DNA_START=23 /DNA_END=757 /DNA_ORIENTATION=-
MKFFTAFLALLVALTAVSGVVAQECDGSNYDGCVSDYVSCFGNGGDNVCDCVANWINCLADEGCICTTDGQVNDYVETVLESYCNALGQSGLCDSGFEEDCRASFSDICNDGSHGSSSFNLPGVYFSYARFVVAGASAQFNSEEFRAAIADFLDIPLVRVIITHFYSIATGATRQTEQTGVDVQIEANSQKDADNLVSQVVDGVNSDANALNGFTVDNAAADAATSLGVATAVLFSAAAVALIM